MPVNGTCRRKHVSVSFPEPLLPGEAGAAENSLQQVYLDFPSMRVRQCHDDVTSHHVRMLPALIGSLETQSTQAPN